MATTPECILCGAPANIMAAVGETDHGPGSVDPVCFAHAANWLQDPGVNFAILAMVAIGADPKPVQL